MENTSKTVIKTFISLGSSCSVSYNLQQLKLKSFTYPFDWLKIPKLQNITECLNNNFKDFMDVTEIKTSDKFPIFDDDYTANSNNISRIMKNKYDMEFYHDFSNNTDHSQINEKYHRRINRFNELLKSPIYFIRDELKMNNIDISQIEEFLSIVLKINKNIKLMIILHNPKNKNHQLLNYKNDNLIVYNDTKPFINWTRPNLDWKNLLN